MNLKQRISSYFKPDKPKLHDCKEAGCHIDPSPQNGVSTENKAAKLVAELAGRPSN